MARSPNYMALNDTFAPRRSDPCPKCGGTDPLSWDRREIVTGRHRDGVSLKACCCGDPPPADFEATLRRIWPLTMQSGLPDAEALGQIAFLVSEALPDLLKQGNGGCGGKEG